MDASTTAVQQAYAAWIQAIGSITGIGVTVYIFWRQSAFLRREANQQKISLLESVLGILQDVELSLEEAAQFWETARNPRTPLLATKRIRLGQALAA
ncbi:hypothetical protein FVF58_48885 [Paraburkholderia panacisoli]|uniref:Uncharacterized protein n=1 Tax=Paraburkholderia panacisoli TaxID=2603818 RepID=A0A5B0G485_9BURK|nr:hypothetical protein [Paraburkholderia panacisoli]KAA0997508.1 hypothetical protein FVF58_48885 [Paraburkholderia panacisoli]